MAYSDTITWHGPTPDSSGDASLKTDGNTHSYSVVYTGTDNSENGLNIPAIQNHFASHYGIALGTPYSYDTLAYCTSIRPKKSEDGYSLEVQVEYGPRDDESDCPWLQRASVQWGYQDQEIICDQDINGDLIANSAGQPFDPPITKTVKIPTLSVTQGEYNFNAVTASQYTNSVNANSFWGCAAQTMRCLITANNQKDGTYGWYWVVNYQFLYNPLTWKKFVLDAGLYEKGSDGKLKKITTKSGEVSSSYPLDGNGKALPQDGTGTPYWQEFEIYNKVNFNFTLRV